jgi:SET domain-containing protein 6
MREYLGALEQDMDDFEAATDRFLAWFKSVGGEFRDDLIVIKDLRAQDAGRGIGNNHFKFGVTSVADNVLVTIKDVPRDTTLFTIPREAIINVETSELIKKLPEVFGELEEGEDEDEDSEPLDSWGSLILVMLYEYLQGGSSRWKPYLDILPQTFDTPIFWTDAELEELRGTCLTEEKIGRKESDEMLRSRILPVVMQHVDVFYPRGATQLSEDELLALAHRMGSTIMAYAFDLENEKEDSDDEEGWVEDREGNSMLGMVPMADILNANAEFNVSTSLCVLLLILLTI